MLVVVTGGAGKVGREAVAALRRAGHGVVVWDVKPVPGERAPLVDCADFGQVFGAMSGVDPFGRTPDAVVHLAGIPAPGLMPDHRIFEINTLSTYNVFSAAARLGVKRVVWASSETILGLPFTTPPEFVPIDETDPDRPEWSYSLAKAAGELMAKHFVRWSPGLSIASLRFSNVFEAADYANLAAIQSRPDQRRLNLWGYVDARDCGEACRLAAEADFQGHQAMVIAAADSIVPEPSAELMARNFPDVPIRGELKGNASLLSSETARRVIGYEPRHSWRETTGRAPD
ncbi:MAG: NAD(P)-dependent oxidoreductase [Caulobacteraceae bacterium]|nr:NAD(P)-dependent oxidoreductase [Caulobacteraceae bacterium]